MTKPGFLIEFLFNTILQCMIPLSNAPGDWQCSKYLSIMDVFLYKLTCKDKGVIFMFEVMMPSKAQTSRRSK